MDVMALVDRAWPLLRRLAGGHVAVYRASGGRIGHRVLGGAPMLLLDHVGARSATPRTTPLIYVEDGENLAIVASKGGHTQHPAWYHNLLAHPDTTVQVGSQRLRVRARVASPQERARLWPKAEAVYGPYREYQARTSREIPIVVLEPRA
jgi:deazaflavin-dependent oxidoreductase (nitroreductase family)